ncbi:unnamed protein product [Prorocentrum cordatum]|uniref:Magnesium transporter n=1 Tax=Prorocentrum cordatum TaxID=2364126 RepID=A0ABN9SFJ7_9DINO|nr:unnamed protein product [Polarella glacialis]CAK0860230.1 unnamed protein product [Polarella glacialis]
MASVYLCGVFAVLSGLVMAVGMNILACARHKKKTACTGCLHMATNLVLQLAAVGLFLQACAWGPVALAMPLETATLLLSNLALQVLLEIGHFDKACLVGTLVLTCAACCLGDVGPEDTTPAEACNATAWNRLLTTPAISWMIFVFFLAVISLVVMRTCQHNVFYNTIGYSLFVAIATAVGAAVGKFLTFTTGSLFGVFFVVYLFCGVGSLLFGAFAARECDLVFFMASNECFKLIITAFTGRFVWHDTPRYWLSYVMVYTLMCLGGGHCLLCCSREAEVQRALGGYHSRADPNSAHPLEFAGGTPVECQ